MARAHDGGWARDEGADIARAAEHAGAPVAGAVETEGGDTDPVQAIEDALRGYLRLNRAAIDLLEPDGVLATCSCSGHVDRGLFADLMGQVAELSGRTIQLLEQRGQAADHPVSASCLETEYLKCFVCRVA